MAVTAPSAPVQSAFYSQIQTQAQQQVGEALGHLQTVPLEIGAQGQFPYYFKDTNNNFNLATWTFLNSVVIPGEAGGVQLSGGQSFTNAYSAFLTATGYKLSTADQAAMNQARIAAQQQATGAVEAYEQTYGTITQAQMTTAAVTTKIDYIIGYQLNQWAGKNAPLQFTGGNIGDLTSLLTNLPASGEQVIGPITQYLQVMAGELGLINSSSAATSLLFNLKYNTQHPSAATGAITTSDNQTHVGFTMSPSDPNQIQTALNNTGSKVAIDFHASDYSADSTTLSVSGGGGGVIPIAEFLGIDVGGGASYNMHDLNTSGDSFDVTMTFYGVNLVNVAPVKYQIDSNTGWYDPEPIAAAVANQGKDVSGFAMQPFPANTDFAEGGNFGLLNGLVISTMPTVTISYASGQASDYASQLEQHSSVGVSLFGIRLGGVDQSYSHSVIEQHSSGGGFDVTFTPAPPSGSSTSQLAYVLSVSVDYPGAGD